MEPDKNSPQAEYRTINIRTTGGATIQGKVNIAHNERVSDLFTGSNNTFIVLVDALLKDGHSKILFVNKDHIVWVEPED